MEKKRKGKEKKITVELREVPLEERKRSSNRMKVEGEEIIIYAPNLKFHMLNHSHLRLQCIKNQESTQRPEPPYSHICE